MLTVGVVVKPSTYYVESGVPAFRSFNVREDRLFTNDLVFFSKQASDGPLSKSRLREGDVLIVRTGYPGTSCVVPKEYNGANCIDLVIARPDPTLVRSEFLSRFFNSASGKQQALHAKVGLAQQHLNVGAVRRTLIPLPPLPEQREIAAQLSAVDAKLAAEEARRAALAALFQSLLHHLLTGKVRLPEFAKGQP
jgi:type I restriction enzyme S subunit